MCGLGLCLAGRSRRGCQVQETQKNLLHLCFKLKIDDNPTIRRRLRIHNVRRLFLTLGFRVVDLFEHKIARSEFSPDFADKLIGNSRQLLSDRS